MGTLSDITANANNTNLRNANPTPKPLTRPGDENSGKAKSPHFMSPTVSSSMQVNAVIPKVLKTMASPTIAASDRKKGWMSSAAKRVGIHRGVHHSANKESSATIKAVTIPDKLTTPPPSNHPASSSPTSTQDPKAHLSAKPLPSPPVAQISKNSPIRESRSLLDASEKPLRRSPPGRPQQEEDWPVLSPESVIAPKPVQSSQDSAYPVFGSASEGKERYPAMTNPDLKPANRECSDECVVRKRVSSADDHYASPQPSIIPNPLGSNGRANATTAGYSLTEAVQFTGSESPPACTLAAPTSERNRVPSSIDRILPRQTKTSELRARRSAGHVNRDRMSTVPEGLGNSCQAGPRISSHDHHQSPSVAFLSRNPLRESSRAPTHTSRVPTQFFAGSRRPIDNNYSARSSLRNDLARRSSIGLLAPSRAAPAAPTSSVDSLLVAKTRIVPVPSAPRPTTVPLPHNVSIDSANTSAKTCTELKGGALPIVKMEPRNEFKIYEDRSSAQNLIDALEEHGTVSGYNLKSNAEDQLPQATTTFTGVCRSSSKTRCAVDIKEQQAIQLAQQDRATDPYSPMSTVCDPRPQDESSSTRLITEKKFSDSTGSIYDDHDKPSNGKTNVKRLSTKAPLLGPMLRISPSAERWVMGNDLEVQTHQSTKTSKRSSSGSSTFTDAVHGLINSAVDVKKRGNCPASAQGLLHPSSARTATNQESKEKRAKSVEMGYSLSTDHLKARVVRSQSQTANRISKFSNDMDPFLDIGSQSKGPQENGSLTKVAGNFAPSRQHNAITEESTTNAGAKKPSCMDLRLIIPDNNKKDPIPEIEHSPAATPLIDTSELANGAAVIEERADVSRKTHEPTFSQVIDNSTPVQLRPFPPRTSSQATPPDFTMTKTTSFPLASASTNAQHSEGPVTAEETSLRPIHKRDSETTTSNSSKRTSTISQSSTTTKNAISNFRARIFHKRPVDKTPTSATTISMKVQTKPTNTTTAFRSIPLAKLPTVNQTLLTSSHIRHQETPSLDSPAPNPVSTSTALVLSLCNRANQDPSSPHRSNILTLSTVLAEAVNHAREAQRSMEMARLAAKEAEGRWRLCVESVRIIEGIVRGFEGMSAGGEA